MEKGELYWDGDALKRDTFQLGFARYSFSRSGKFFWTIYADDNRAEGYTDTLEEAQAMAVVAYKMGG